MSSARGVFCKIFDRFAWAFLQVWLLQENRNYKIFSFYQLARKFCLASVKLIEMGGKLVLFLIAFGYLFVSG